MEDGGGGVGEADFEEGGGGQRSRYGCTRAGNRGRGGMREADLNTGMVVEAGSVEAEGQ